MSVAEVADRDSNRIIERQLDERIEAVAEAWDRDVIAYLGPMFAPADDAIKDAIEAMAPRREGLLFILETGGGHITTAERIARILRHHYPRVEFAVPTYAMSAGTVLVMSGDAIHMDYASTLGPIDPQVRNRAEQWVPALGYLEQYNRLIQKSADGTLTTAELAYLIENFDPAELYQYEQERELSIALLEEWLAKYKFQNWTTTATRKMPVTDEMRIQRARGIAEKLNDMKLWHSHSRGIPMEMLRRELNLLIDDFGARPDVAQPMHDYFRLLQDYRMRLGHLTFVMHRRTEYVGF
ncbi:MAG: serine dehydrogenasease [Chloroflexi bacterium]|nr:serine dehydrogenasease [Chloroflexota bacterium]